MAQMTLWEKIQALAHLLKWRFTWNRRNTHYRFTVENNPKFMGPRDAIQLIEDGDVCMVAGLAGNQRISILAWALREVFEETNHPNNLTLISLGGQGGRGKAPGTLEELGLEGLIARFFSGHHETYKSLLDLAAAGKLELQCLPQGVLALLIEAQANGEDSLVLETGVGTYCDPRVGEGSAPFDANAEAFIAAEGDKLRYRLPKITVAIFNAPAADREGNIYVHNCATISETREVTLAARRNGGKVIALVGRIIDKNEAEIFLPAEQIDAIVQYYDAEQTATFLHSGPSEYFIAGSNADAEKGMEMVRFFNQVMGITPRRNNVQKALARLAAKLICEHVEKGAMMNIGTGLPEEVGQILFQEGLLKDKYTLFTEAGAIGGMPAPGIFFGAAIAPKEIVSSPEIFQRIYKNLDATVLGFLQVDSKGNVNASKRGESATEFVGPGGFIDFTHNAKNIFFVGSWTARGKVALRSGKVRLKKYGQPKFVDKVNQITFNGARALQAGKKVFFITDVGAFQLTEKGIELIYIMPGVDIQRHIVEFAKTKIIVGDDVPVADSSLVSGDEFRL